MYNFNIPIFLVQVIIIFYKPLGKKLHKLSLSVKKNTPPSPKKKKPMTYRSTIV